MKLHQLNQYKKIIREAIALLELDLSEKVILTEAGSGAFLFTPVIAAMANAKKVIVCCNDSIYGKAGEIISDCKNAIAAYDLQNDFLFITNQKPYEHIPEADIITNSSHLRPLDAALLSKANDKAVIPLMYEKWELRPTDIDISYCTERNIRVAGTWENFPSLKIFDFVEQLIIKMCFEAGYEISGNRIIVWSNDHFGEMAVKGFTANNAKSVKKLFSVNDLLSEAGNCDFILFCDYMDERILIGEDGIINIEELKKINDSIGIVHLSGNIDNGFVSRNNIAIYPDVKGKAIKMTQTLSHVGKRPAIYLNAAGLKVGECLSNNIKSELVQPVNF